MLVDSAADIFFWNDGPDGKQWAKVPLEIFLMNP
jgi:hypothetical protein